MNAKPECWVSQEALDNLREEGSHVGAKTVLWNTPNSKNGKVRVALYAEPVSAREELAKFMLRNSFATGHGDTIGDLLAELEVQIGELRARLP